MAYHQIDSGKFIFLNNRNITPFYWSNSKANKIFRIAIKDNENKEYIDS